MRIVYTNLQEDDFGVKRSVKRLQVDFNRRTTDRTAVLTEEKLRNDAGDSRKSPYRVFSAERWRAGYAEHPDKEKNESGTDESSEEPRPTSPPCLVPKAGSIRGFYIKRFTETQLLTAGRIEPGNRISIFA